MGARGGSLLERWKENLAESWWLIPLGSVIAACVLAFASAEIDARLKSEGDAWYLYRGGPVAARDILSVIATSAMSLSALTFSVTILVLQLASNQFTPRALHTFMKDRGSQAVLGTFVGTFAFALLALRNTRGVGGDGGSVPALTVWLGILLALGSVIAFVFYIHHVAQSIRAVVIIRRIGSEVREVLPRLYPEPYGEEAEAWPVLPPGPPARLPNDHRSGVVASVEADELFDIAVERNVTIRLVPMIGDFVVFQSTLFEVWGDPRDVAELDRDELVGAVNLSIERTIRQDPAFGIRQLVDIAERALSPGINDPTTAVQALDEIHDILRRLLGRSFPSPRRADEHGCVRLILPRPDWDAYLSLAVDEIRGSARGSLQIARRLRFLLEDLRDAAPAGRRAAIERELLLLDLFVRREFPEPIEQRIAMLPSRQGHGPS